jgi:Protein HRI1
MDPLSVKDEGVFEKLENGDELEQGTMVNPDTNTVMAYEEVWRSVPIEHDASATLLESVGEKDKAMVGRIGKWFQGIATKDGRISALRAEHANGQWKIVYSTGLCELVPLFSEDGWKKGDEVSLSGRRWKVLDRK